MEIQLQDTLGKIISRLGEGVTIKRLWRNPDPTVSFPEQFLKVDGISECEMAIVYGYESTTSTTETMTFARRGKTTRLRQFYNYRQFRAFDYKDNDEVWFGAGYEGAVSGSASVKNTAAIPVEIYGVKLNSNQRYLAPDYMEDYVVEIGTSGIWKYRKWASGKAECWGIQTVSGSYSAWGSIYAYDIAEIAFPSGLFKTLEFETAQAKSTGGNIVSSMNSHSGSITTASQLTCIRATAYGGTYEFSARRYAIGTWK